MKQQTEFLLATVFLSGVLIVGGCKKQDPPKVTTAPVSEVTLTTAKAGGDITDDGGAEVTARGVCWSTGTSPTTADHFSSDGTGVGEYTTQISGLTEGTTYHARAYATNSEGTAYGEEVSFTTISSTPASITTAPATAITLTSATAGGNVTNDGFSTVTARGVCWSTLANPTTENSKTVDGDGVGEFSSSITGLLEGTTYHLRAYAVNSKGTSYGSEITFTTLATSEATVTTAEVTGITLTSAVSGGNVTNDGLSGVTSRGICWGTAPNPTIESPKTSDGTGTGEFSSNLTGLLEGTKYYVRAYVVNGKGTSYGNEVSFTTLAASEPTLTTADISSVTFNSAVAGGNITSDGLADVTARGVCWSTAPGPTVENSKTTDGTGTGAFSSNLTGLTDGITYYLRAYATNSKGTAYGNEINFTTHAAGTATLSTVQLSGLTVSAVVTGGNISADGGSAVTSRGVVWGTTPNPTVDGSKTTNGSGTGTFASNLSGLTAGTVYHLRAYATNNKGTAYGNEITFVTPIADLEGNVYKTVLIGNQVWMADNLKSTRYNDNTAIPEVADSLSWMGLTTPAFTWYRGKVANKQYGAIYNWFTVATGNLCPQGWHVPTNAEYMTMETTLGIPADSVGNWGWRGTGVGNKLKDSIAWGPGDGNNSSGFTAMPTGYRAWANGEFRGLNVISFYWSSTDDAVNHNPTVAWYRRLDAGVSWVYMATTEKAGGKSVRCMKNP